MKQPIRAPLFPDEDRNTEEPYPTLRLSHAERQREVDLCKRWLVEVGIPFPGGHGSGGRDYLAALGVRPCPSAISPSQRAGVLIRLLGGDRSGHEGFPLVDRHARESLLKMVPVGFDDGTRLHIALAALARVAAGADRAARPELVLLFKAARARVCQQAKPELPSDPWLWPVGLQHAKDIVAAVSARVSVLEQDASALPAPYGQPLPDHTQCGLDAARRYITALDLSARAADRLFGPSDTWLKGNLAQWMAAAAPGYVITPQALCSAVIEWLGAVASPQVPNTVAKKVGDWWSKQVQNWCDKQLPGQPAAAFGAEACARELLVAMNSFAAPRGSANAAHIADCVGRAIARFCPTEALHAASAASVPLRQAITVAMRVGASSGHAVPAPWGEPLPTRGELACRRYIKWLASHQPAPEVWAGQVFVAALGRWFDALTCSGPEKAASGARAALECLGGSRDLDCNWINREFYEAAHTWCCKRMAASEPDMQALMARRIRNGSHVRLLVTAIDSLASAGARPLPRGALAAAAEESAKRGSGHLKRTQGQQPISLAYQPAGHREPVVTPEQGQRLEFELESAHGRERLRALYLLRHVHGALAMTGSSMSHKSQAQFYPRLSLLLDRLDERGACRLRCAATPRPLIDALVLLWLWPEGEAPGAAPRWPGTEAARLPSAFNPTALHAPILRGHVQRMIPHIDLKLRTVEVAAAAMLEPLTDPLAAAMDEPCFDPDAYAYLENALDGRRVDRAHPDFDSLDAVHRANRVLFGRLKLGELQYRIRAALAQTGGVPKAIGCPVCQQP